MKGHEGNPSLPLAPSFRNALLIGLRRFLQIIQNLFGVAVGLYFFEDVLNFAVRAENERGACDPEHFLAVHVLFLQNPIGNGRFSFGVGQEGERQAFLIGEFSLGAGGIWGDAKQHGAGLLNLFI